MNQPDTMFTILDVREIGLDFPASCPLTQTLDLWRQWAGGRPAPAWKNVELYNLPPIIVPQTLVVDVIDGGRDYHYRFWGSKYTDQYGLDDTGMLLSETLGPEFIKATFQQLHAVMDDKRPHAFDVAIRAPQSGVLQTKINLRLPVMSEPDTVTQIITATLFNETTRKDIERLNEAFERDLDRRGEHN